MPLVLSKARARNLLQNSFRQHTHHINSFGSFTYMYILLHCELISILAEEDKLQVFKQALLLTVLWETS
eukprot:snap_masked-scaffold_3-processed-gene-9.8-mRNA-1 protein AED:1.00 eAED:1.00 QI:0/0/0/0/1/1/2/0/68